LRVGKMGFRVVSAQRLGCGMSYVRRDEVTLLAAQ
jgi:hypothetical protein